MKKTALAATLLLALPGTAISAIIVTPSGVTASHSLSAYPIIHTINSHGLNDADPNILNWTHDPTPSNTNDKSWLGNLAGAEVIYQLPGPITLTDLYFWAYYGGTDTRAVTALDISFSSDGGSNYSAATTLNMGTPNAATEQFALGTQTNVTHVRFNNIQNGGNNLVGIGEVRFGAIPEPSSWVLASIALGVTVLRRRR